MFDILSCVIETIPNSVRSTHFFSPQSGSLIAWWQRHAYPASRSSLGMRVEGRKTVEGRHEC